MEADASREPNSEGAQTALRTGAECAVQEADGCACGASQTCRVPEESATARRPKELQQVCTAAGGNSTMVEVGIVRRQRRRQALREWHSHTTKLLTHTYYHFVCENPFAFELFVGGRVCLSTLTDVIL